jgi:predicted XRE-type DNA-binding protein
MKTIENIEYEKGSNNVFTDLGLENAEELFIRSQIGFHIYQILKQKNLKEEEIPRLLKISQSDVSHLMNGHSSQFTTDKLLNFLKFLDMKVTI